MSNASTAAMATRYQPSPATITAPGAT
jgi:hypothetical protein